MSGSAIVQITAAVEEDTAVLEPPALEAVTATRMKDPTSAAVSM